jgi:hypothetical protein
MGSSAPSPVDAFLAAKTAGFGEAFKASGNGLRGRIGGALLGAGASAAVGIGVAGAGLAAQKIYDAATKGRDFRRLLEVNPDLADHHAEDPRAFNQLFSSLRTFNPAFSRDPLVAGSYMRRMLDSPMMAGGVLTDALAMRDRVPHPMGESFHEYALEGAKAGLKQSGA